MGLLKVPGHAKDRRYFGDYSTRRCYSLSSGDRGLANLWNTGVNNVAKDTEPFRFLTGMAQQTAEQITKQTRGAMQDYFSWLQNAMSASPWGSMDLNKKLLSYATENVTAAVTFVHKLSQAKDLQDVVKIQTEFVQMQIETFN